MKGLQVQTYSVDVSFPGKGATKVTVQAPNSETALRLVKAQYAGSNASVGNAQWQGR